MLKGELQPGEEYALRQKNLPGVPFERVRILGQSGTKWKVEWIEPNPGIIDVVVSRKLVARWNDREAVLRDERAERQLREDNQRLGHREESALVDALCWTFVSTGENDLLFDRGTLTGPPEALDRVLPRAGGAGARSPFTYTDRRGVVHVPFGETVALAQAFCAAEPATVLADAERAEHLWTVLAAGPDGQFMLDLLNRYRPAWALIRQWSGHDPAQAGASMERLERVVQDALSALEKAGLDAEARRLRQLAELEGEG